MSRVAGSRQFATAATAVTYVYIFTFLMAYKLKVRKRLSIVRGNINEMSIRMACNQIRGKGRRGKERERERVFDKKGGVSLVAANHLFH